MRKITAIIGGALVFGAAGTDQMYTEMRQMPPDYLWIVLIVGLVLLLPALFFRNRKVKK